MLGHQSIFRKLAYGRIEIIKVRCEEVEEIVRNVEINSNRRIRFEESFIKDVFDKSGGYPYFVQLFGQLALDNYIKLKGINPPIIIHPQYLKNGLAKLKIFEFELEKDYIIIVKESAQRELLLKFLAKQSSKKISDEIILAYCHKHGITQPEPKYLLANYLGQRDPQFLIREREDSEFVTFADPLFKIYINSREPDFLKSKDGQYRI